MMDGVADRLMQEELLFVSALSTHTGQSSSGAFYFATALSTHHNINITPYALNSAHLILGNPNLAMPDCCHRCPESLGNFSYTPAKMASAPWPRVLCQTTGAAAAPS